MVKSFKVDVISEVKVNVADDSVLYNQEFIEHFKQYFYELDTVEEHITNLARLYASGIIYDHNQFVEGYGYLSDIGVTIDVIDVYNYDAEEVE